MNLSLASNLAYPREYAAVSALEPLQPFFDDQTVTEVAVNRPGECWSFDGAWRSHDMPVLTREYLGHLRRAITHLNPGSSHDPSISVLLPGGSRGQIVTPLACPDDRWQMCVRKHSAAVMKLEELDARGLFDGCRDVSFNLPGESEILDALTATDFSRIDPVEAELLRLKAEGRWLDFLVRCVREKRNIILAGATGSGKTTVMRSLIDKVPTTERVLTIEDVIELLLPNHRNHVQMLYGDRDGMLTAQECIRAALRMKPDRVFLSEFRGAEAWDYLRVVNTGHPGSIVTAHTNSALDTPSAVALLAMEHDAGKSLGYDLLTRLLYGTLHVVLYMSHWKVTEVYYDPIFAKKARGPR